MLKITQPASLFTINTQVLSIPNPISPADGSKLGLTGGITPDIRWSPVSAPNGGVTYDLQIDNDRDFPIPFWIDRFDCSSLYTHCD